MESPNLWMTALVYFHTDEAQRDRALSSTPNRILLCFFLAHYVHRSVLYPIVRMRGRTNAPMPLNVMFLAFAFCLWNGFQQSTALLAVHVYDDEEWLMDWRFQCGIIMATIGMFINVHSDSILLSLSSSRRKSGGGESASSQTKALKRYQIPRGGMFEYVSAANYFGEILEWSGFAMACWSLPALAFALYTASNIGPRGYNHHQWYKEHFGKTYPPKRKAIIPFIL